MRAAVPYAVIGTLAAVAAIAAIALHSGCKPGSPSFTIGGLLFAGC